MSSLIEALRSGKRFRRKGDPNLMPEHARIFSKEDILAECEIEPDPQPKLRAWIVDGSVRFTDSQSDIFFEYSGKPPKKITRAPWLDPPEDAK